jgi:hypothetical protein
LTLRQFNRSFYYPPDPDNTWNVKTDIVDETERNLDDEVPLSLDPMKPSALSAVRRACGAGVGDGLQPTPRCQEFFVIAVVGC